MLDAVTPQTRAIIINSPCNPTGALMTEDEMATLVDGVAGTNIWVILDLCYEQLIYEPVPHNLPKVLADAMRDRTILCGSASKSYAMTGWRCGWAVGPGGGDRAPATRSRATRRRTSLDLAEGGGRGAHRAAGLRQGDARRIPQAPRRSCTRWLTADPRIKCVKPDGAFYLFIDISALLSPDGIRTSAEFAERLLHEAHVALTAGEGFEAPGFLRISYATSMEQLQEGANAHSGLHPEARSTRARCPRSHGHDE